jgi:pSer/pThr/pTyr-binding forkhead associated (FHA) protein
VASDHGRVEANIERIAMGVSLSRRVARLGAWVLIALAMVPLGGCLRMSSRSAEKSVYRIIVGDPSKISGSGTAFLVQGDNIVVTNRHVVDAGPNYEIAYLDERGEAVFVRAVLLRKANPPGDLALLKTDRPLPGSAFRLSPVEPDIGVKVRAIGFPGAVDLAFEDGKQANSKAEFFKPRLKATTTEGSVSQIREFNAAKMVQHTALISEGNSGGPLIDDCGHVVGVNTWGSAKVRGYQGSIHSSDVASFMRQASQDPSVPALACYAEQVERYGPFAMTGVAAMLGLTAVVMVRRRPQIIQESYTRLRRGVTSVVRYPVRHEKPAPYVPPPSAPPAPAQLAPPSAPQTAYEPPGSTRLVAEPADAKAPLPAFRLPPGTEPQGTVKLVPTTATGAPIAIPMAQLHNGNGLVVGRHSEADVTIAHETISKKHARLRLDGSQRIMVDDLGSANGTWKGHVKVTTDEVKPGDTLRFGSVGFRIEVDTGLARPPAPTPVQGLAPPSADQPFVLSGFDEGGKVIRFTLLPQGGGADSTAGEKLWRVGRKPGRVDVLLSHKTVSSEHARIRFTANEGWAICDLDSSNGTFLDGRQVRGDFVPLKGVRKVKFGSCELTVAQV